MDLINLIMQNNPKFKSNNQNLSHKSNNKNLSHKINQPLSIQTITFKIKASKKYKHIPTKIMKINQTNTKNHYKNLKSNHL